jgi:hypothetical protein
MFKPIPLAALALLLTAAPWPASAAPLNPLAYAPLGALNLAPGTYTLDTSGPAPTLRDGASNLLFTGVLQAQASSFNPQIAVFSFGSIQVAAGATINATGDKPMAWLSQSSISFAGTLDASGKQGGPQGGGFGGAGGHGGGAGGAGGGNPAQSGQGPGGGAGGFAGLGNGSWGEGGAFGGAGSNWNPALTPAPAYGDLTQRLEAGSGGGGGGANLFGSGPGGGGGGGGVEFGALSFITLAGDSNVLVAGGAFREDGLAVNSGGGSGGGVLLHAPTISLLANVRPAIVDASGFSGGRIAFFTGDGTVQGNQAGLSVGAFAAGNVGVITYNTLSPVPEPATALLMLAGAAALMARRRVAAG